MPFSRRDDTVSSLGQRLDVPGVAAPQLRPRQLYMSYTRE